MRGAWSGRSIGPSTSFASDRTNAGIVLHLRFQMPLRWPQEIHNDELSMRASAAQSTYCGPTFARTALLQGENLFAKQSHLIPAAQPGWVTRQRPQTRRAVAEYADRRLLQEKALRCF